MKKIIWILAAVIILAGASFAAFLFFRGSSGQPVSPEMLKPGVTDYGTLKVLIKGKGQPLNDVEVDLGTISSGGPTGPMTFKITDESGLALFENVPVGNYNVFFNTNHYPADFAPYSEQVSVKINQGQTTEKTIELKTK